MSFVVFSSAVFMHAVEEAIIALVKIYQSLTFQLADSCPEPLDLKQGITVAPKGGIPVYVLLRTT